MVQAGTKTTFSFGTAVTDTMKMVGVWAANAAKFTDIAHGPLA